MILDIRVIIYLNMNVKYDYNLFYIYDTFQDVGVNRKRYNFSVSSWATSSS